MSQIIRATFSPLVPGQGKMRKVEKSGRRYISDSSMRTNPSIDDPSNMILPSSASSNWRSGISTFLIVPRMSVNCRRRHFTFSRSARSRICAFVSLAFDADFAMARFYRSQKRCRCAFNRPTFLMATPSHSAVRSKPMKTFIFGTLIAAAALSAVVIARPFETAPPAQGGQDRPGERQPRDFMVLAGRGSEIGVQIAEGKTEGVVVEEVRPDSPAEKAGLKKADTIVEFDGERVRGTRQFGRLVQETPPGKTVKATIVRDGRRQTVEIAPREGRGALSDRFMIDGDRFRIDGDRFRMPDLDALRNLPRGPFNFDFDFPGALSGRRLGVTVDPLPDQLAQYFGAKDGVLVTSVADGSPASRAGLKAGDVITSIDGQSVRSTDDLVRAMRDARNDEVTIEIVRDKKTSSVKATLEGSSRRMRGARPV